MVGTRSKKNVGHLSQRQSTPKPTSAGDDSEGPDSTSLRIIVNNLRLLTAEGRDDYDYYEPTSELDDYPQEDLSDYGKVLEFSKEARNPSDDDRQAFKYVEISSIDTDLGQISDFTEIPCDSEYVPSRARNVIHTGDILISTVRPTRRAVALVPEHLDNEICSTGFAVVRVKEGVALHPGYLLYSLRSNVVIKQFGKFASGSSYPAILDKHIKMTKFPLPDYDTQAEIAEIMHESTKRIIELKNEIKAIQTTARESSENLLRKTLDS